VQSYNLPSLTSYNEVNGQLNVPEFCARWNGDWMCLKANIGCFEGKINRFSCRESNTILRTHNL
jgi:hypothetical protein